MVTPVSSVGADEIMITTPPPPPPEPAVPGASIVAEPLERLIYLAATMTTPPPAPEAPVPPAPPRKNVALVELPVIEYPRTA